MPTQHVLTVTGVILSCKPGLVQYTHLDGLVAAAAAQTPVR